MKNRMFKFFDAWYFIQEHPKFLFKGELQTFPHGLDIQPVMVNPETMEVDDDESKNTQLQIWLEYGPYEGKDPTHDIDLDCGGGTFEEAIVNLAQQIKAKYGDY